MASSALREIAQVARDRDRIAGHRGYEKLAIVRVGQRFGPGSILRFQPDSFDRVEEHGRPRKRKAESWPTKHPKALPTR
jgi:hypothetical protein